MSWPQWILIIAVIVTVLMDLVRDGERRMGEHRVLFTFVRMAVLVLLLGWGGFFHGGAA